MKKIVGKTRRDRRKNAQIRRKLRQELVTNMIERKDEDGVDVVRISKDTKTKNVLETRS